MPSRSSDNHHQHHRNPSNYRGGFSGGGGGGGGGHHPRQLFDSPPPNQPLGGGGFRPMGAGGFGAGGGAPPVPLSGQKRGFSFSGRSGSPPDNTDTGGFAKLFVGSVPRTATEEDVRPLFEEHGDVIEVALIKDKRTGQQQGPFRALMEQQ